ncbi:hypothetical protein MUK42_20154 [Musa troglodytarum]|uniref:Uncharacterized protein n=1 Tax=Musa troglodytarum TaxID=320322 RepID=A0A9E7E8A0_9LILI|nr:hypothetical protein MUK42_20154 [Musa troglodytarum]
MARSHCSSSAAALSVSSFSCISWTTFQKSWRASLQAQQWSSLELASPPMF